MAVIESIMVLYAREVITPDRVFAAVQRFNDGRQPTPHVPDNHEQAVFVWMSHACDALKKRIEQDSELGVTNGGGSVIYFGFFKENVFMLPTIRLIGSLYIMS